MNKLISLFKRTIKAPGGRWPSWRQLSCWLKVLPRRERWLARGFSFVIIASIAALFFSAYWFQTQSVPKSGGKYTEGILGQPRYINPVLAQTNDADRDLVRLVFSGLFKYDGQGNLIPDLARDYTVETDGLTYNVFLKENVFWHNGEPLKADDVIFTIKTIQNPEYRSPLKVNWQGVVIEKVDDLTIRFKLNNVYAPFLHNLTVAILPKHLWSGISAQNFALAEYNLKPIGSGPYQFEKLIKDKDGKVVSIELIRNEQFYLQSDSNGEIKPFIEKIALKFYNSQTALIEAKQKGQIDGLSFLPAKDQTDLESNLNIHQISLPSYYALFFNQTKSKPLADKTVRLALAHSVDKGEIINQVLNGQGVSVNSPLLEGWPSWTSETKVYDFSPEHARNILEAEDWKDTDEDGFREKTIDDEEVKLEIGLLTTNWPELRQTAEMIKGYWEEIGVKVNLSIVDAASVQQDYIRPREYDALLFGEVLGADPDPFAFWHSSQKKDPGLNLALYQNDDADKLLEDARQVMDQEIRTQKYVEFQKTLTENIPAIFLYSATYLYPVVEKIKGISIERITDHSQRFSQVEDWYIKTKRVEK
ncbi:MAG: ABC transporter substrate-binding protein [Candidatus Portnoybacteria bacterium]|nr:ABC transporter substrate-binding protein [Candidatus Portnoybacteria bacterium]